MKRMKRMSCAVLFVILFLAYAAPRIFAQATYTAASCNQSDVQAVVSTAADGDTVNIPAGSCTWTSGVTLPSHIGITITGSGTPNSGSSTSAPSLSCASGTVLTLSPTSTTTAFTFSPEYGNSTTRLSCMTIAYGSGPSIAFKILGTCTSSGCPNLRLDNITFSNWGGHANAGISYGLGAIGDMFGVVDHNSVTGLSTSGEADFIEQSNASYLGVGSYGDNSWAQPENFGSANFLFVENNTFNYASVGDNEGSAGTLSNQGGGRIVARHNTFSLTSSSVALSWHGTESSGRPRSSRAWEFYENTLTCPASTECLEEIGARGGTGLSWGNTITGTSAGIGSYVSLDTYRSFGNPGGWGPCDGSTVYDTNDGTTYYSGTITAYNSGTGVITVSGSPGWTTNEWVQSGAPYSVHDITQDSGTEITANGSNTLTLNIAGIAAGYVPATSDSIQILRATHCLDQAGGRGAGILYSGSPASPLSAADEAVSPSYAWMMSGLNPGFGVISPDTARVIANRDYYAESANQAAQTSSSSPFNGSSGMGHGTLANRPTTCTPAVAYWATDQNTLYQCTGTNTWTAYYTPYTYPHPLTTGTSSPPAPSGLQAIVQ